VAVLSAQETCGRDWHEADACSACDVAPFSAGGESIYLTLLVNLYFLRFAISSIKLGGLLFTGANESSHVCQLGKHLENLGLELQKKKREREEITVSLTALAGMRLPCKKQRWVFFHHMFCAGF